jgi:hypothetical protein
MTSDREVAMSRQQYLERARECREIAATMKGENKQKLLQVAEAWVMLARGHDADESAVDTRLTTYWQSGFVPGPCFSLFRHVQPTLRHLKHADAIARHRHALRNFDASGRLTPVSAISLIRPVPRSRARRQKIKVERNDFDPARWPILR